MKVAAASLNQSPLAHGENLDNILNAIQNAKEKNADLLVLPELALTSYDCGDYFLSTSLQEKAKELLLSIIEHTSDIAVTAGMPLNYKGKLYNAVCVIANKKIIGASLKQNITNQGIHYESRWFTEAKAGFKATYKIGEHRFPIGDLIYKIKNELVGIEICQDAWVDKRPAKIFAKLGATVILNCSASHFEFKKHNKRLELCQKAAMEYNVSYIYVNALGNSAGRAIYDGEIIFAKNNSLLLTSNRFSFKSYGFEFFDLGEEKNKNIKSIDIKKTDTDIERIDTDIEKTDTDIERIDTDIENMKVKYTEHEYTEFTKAVALGLFDYLRKTKAGGYALSLSGGADSSAVAVLVAMMVNIAIDDLGIDEFCEKLNHIKSLSNLKYESGKELKKEVLGKILQCMYQKTKYNSEKTFNSAKDLCDDLGINLNYCNIDDLVDSYNGLGSSLAARELTAQQDSLTLQNIQARVRSVGIWLLANLNNSIVLCTSNRSELSAGYNTMDGDTAGGLSPIAGVSKYFLQNWLKYIEQKGCCGYRFLSLQSVNAFKPSAELKPEEQYDELELMPYKLMDIFEELIIKDKLDLSASLEKVLNNKELVKIYSKEELKIYLDDFILRLRKNQWKRERSATSFHLDRFSVDPKTWFKVPVVSGTQ